MSPRAPTARRLSAAEEARTAHELVARIVAEAPRRMATSGDERRAHELVRAEMDALGLRTEVHAFRWNRSTYTVLALHFGLGVVGSVAAFVSPALALALHALAAVSFVLESTRAAFLLRRVFPFAASQNVLGVRPASGTPRLRVVVLAHVDAAFTGVVFRPAFIARFGSKPGSPLYKSLRVAAAALVALAVTDVLELALGGSWPLWVARAVLSIPALVATLLNLDVVLRNQIVPGASDDLSGVAAMLLLGRRLQSELPDDVELVLVATGCEEAGLGGAQALLRDLRARWSPADTVVLGLDSPTNGDLCYYHEGEVLRVPLAPWLEEVLLSVSAADAALADVRAFDIPVGGTDAIPFARAGYPAVTLGCVDRRAGAPRHYHLPSDTPEHLEVEQIPRALDLAERVVAAIVARPGGSAGPR
ncbi:MAG: M20/M25/M40 family metallo-hydrolase [Polyangiaceae bacterium]|nr:M20/M25/M40 family metallo-hydrolase [Polyangiaceae bacterium]